MKIYRVFGTVVLLFTCFLIVGCNSNKTSDNNTKSEISDTAKVTGTKEDRIFAITKDINDEKKVKEILAQFNNFDWHTYNETSGDQSMQLIEYLYRNQYFIESGDYPNLILATKGLDGALSESFAAIGGDIFKRDRDGLVKALADTDDISQKKQFIRYIAYNLSYQDVKPIVTELEQLIINNKYSTAEKEVMLSLIEDLCW